MKQQKIARELARRVEQLTGEWMRQVREDDKIHSDEGLSNHELRDHIPALLEEIGELIQAEVHATRANTIEARASVYLRYHQGYRGRELIREISLLRLVLHDTLTALAEPRALDLAVSDYAKAARIINQYLDEEMRYAISVWGDASASPQTS